MKFGRKNEINVNPLAYNFMLIGESGIGKSTTIAEYVNKLAPGGYLFAEVGKEDGGDCIDGLNYVSTPTWSEDYDDELNTIGFHTLVEDIVENKTTDWKDLKVLVIDTLDELFAIVEPEVIRMHNKENPTKQVKSIKAAFGGFQAGEDKAVELVLNDLWALKKVGVSFVIIGHTKNRTMHDPVTGEDYVQLTTNMSTKYFNALKTKVHFLGVASIDREIIREKGRKNIVTGKVEDKGVVKSEYRKVTFRDENYNIDAKSRFANIADSVPLDADALIKAITDAINSEQAKSGVSREEAVKRQTAKEVAFEERVTKNETAAKDKKEIDEIVSQIVDFFTENKTNMDKVRPVLAAVKKAGYGNPKEISSLEDAKAILALTL